MAPLHSLSNWLFSTLIWGAKNMVRIRPTFCILYSGVGDKLLMSVNGTNYPRLAFHWTFVVHEKNYSLDCMAGEHEGKSDHFQCAVHLPVDKWNWHKNFLILCIIGVLMYCIVGIFWECTQKQTDTQYCNYIPTRKSMLDNAI